MDVFLYVAGCVLIIAGFLCGLTYDSPYDFLNDMVKVSYISSGITAGIFFFWMGNVTQHLREIKELISQSKDEQVIDDKE